MIDIGDEVLIKGKNNINVVAAIKRNKAKIDIVVITVMRKKNFKPKTGTFVINI